MRLALSVKSLKPTHAQLHAYSPPSHSYTMSGQQRSLIRGKRFSKIKAKASRLDLQHIYTLQDITDVANRAQQITVVRYKRSPWFPYQSLQPFVSSNLLIMLSMPACGNVYLPNTDWVKTFHTFDICRQPTNCTRHQSESGWSKGLLKEIWAQPRCNQSFHHSNCIGALALLQLPATLKIT